MSLAVITQVFPDEFHLNTLDQFLSATARLNPHVNVRAIVIGMMDKLSTYAARESETETLEERQKKEQEATVKLLEKLRLAEDAKTAAEAPDTKKDALSEILQGQSNGESGGDSHPTETGDKPKEDTPEAASTKGRPAVDGEHKENEGPHEDGAEPQKAAVADDVKLYEIFFQQVVHLVQAQRMPIQDVIALLVSLLNLALRIYPDRLDYVDQVLLFATEKVEQYANSADLHSSPAQTNLLNLLLAPVKCYASLFTALALPGFLPLLRAQTYPTRRAVAREVARNLMRNGTKIETTEHVEGIMEVLRVLVKEGMQQPTGYPGVQTQRRGIETDETIEEQGWLARIVHQISSADNDAQFKVGQRRFPF